MERGCTFFFFKNLSQLFFLVSWTFWDKLVWLLSRRLSSMFSCWLCRVFPLSKGKQTLSFSAIRSRSKFGGLVGSSLVNQFCTVTGFFAWITSSYFLDMTAFTSSWGSTVILMTLEIKCTVWAMVKVGGTSRWHFALPAAGRFVQWLALKGFFFFLPVTYLCL